MLLDGSILDLGDVEAKIKGFLASGEDVDSNVQQACVVRDRSRERVPPPGWEPVVSLLATR